MEWPTVTLGDIFEIARGGSPRPIDNFISDEPDAVNWISIRDASASGKYIERTKLKIRKEGVARSRMVQPGDFLLTNSMSFGRPYIMRTAGCIHDGWLVLSDRRGVADQDFFYHLLGSDFIYRKFERLAAGAVVKNLNISLVQGVEVPLPPLTEQRRIAAILDKADAIRRKRQESIDLTDELRRSTFLEMFGDPVSNPRRWPRAPLGTLAGFVGGGTPSRQNASYFTGELCWATPKDMRSEVLTDTEEHITDLALQGSAAKVVPPGTLLVVVKSKVLAHRLPVARAAVRTCFGQDLKGICMHDQTLVRYVHRHLLVGQSALLERARGLNTEGLTLEHLREYMVMLPPATQISRFTEIEMRLEGALQRERWCLSAAAALCNSLGARAFSGEL